MKTSPNNSLVLSITSLRSRLGSFLPAAAILLLLLSAGSNASAGSATWKASPNNGDWNKANNWTPATIPNGPSDTATFATSNKTAVSFSAPTEVNSLVYNPGASGFTISVTTSGANLTLSGVGITNNSGITQNFGVGDPNGGETMSFTNSATAGSSTSFTIDPFGVMSFFDSSSAGSGAFTVQGGGDLRFRNTASAGNGTFTVNADPSFFATLCFFESSTAGNGTFILNPGGGNPPVVFFTNSSTAGNGAFTLNGATVPGQGGSVTQIVSSATVGSGLFIVNGGLNGGNGGQLLLRGDTFTGGTARVEVFGDGTGDLTNGNLDISGQQPPGVAIGSIEGSGAVFLGANKLTVGANNLNTTFSGIISDGGVFGGTGGSLSKTGKGKLTLTTANTYTGGTIITKGTLLAKNKTGSATGTGAVQDNGGTLGGTGKISGAVTVATATSAATLAPGTGSKPSTLTLLSTLTFDSVATYKADLNSSTVKSDKVSAKGVTINSGAQITLTDHGTGVLPAGTVFTLINNTASSAAIAGTFSNLADGATTSINGNNYQADYEGGTGNDLTLTVVP